MIAATLMNGFITCYHYYHYMPSQLLASSIYCVYCCRMCDHKSGHHLRITLGGSRGSKECGSMKEFFSPTPENKFFHVELWDCCCLTRELRLASLVFTSHPNKPLSRRHSLLFLSHSCRCPGCSDFSETQSSVSPRSSLIGS